MELCPRSIGLRCELLLVQCNGAVPTRLVCAVNFCSYYAMELFGLQCELLLVQLMQWSYPRSIGLRCELDRYRLFNWSIYCPPLMQ